MPDELMFDEEGKQQHYLSHIPVVFACQETNLNCYLIAVLLQPIIVGVQARAQRRP